eukprot:jgi/Chrpa1/9257/Chrysochromulina_OHIO_Genome00004931-RA
MSPASGSAPKLSAYVAAAWGSISDAKTHAPPSASRATRKPPIPAKSSANRKLQGRRPVSEASAAGFGSRAVVVLWTPAAAAAGMTAAAIAVWIMAAAVAVKRGSARDLRSRTPGIHRI